MQFRKFMVIAAIVCFGLINVAGISFAGDKDSISFVRVGPHHPEVFTGSSKTPPGVIMMDMGVQAEGQPDECSKYLLENNTPAEATATFSLPYTATVTAVCRTAGPGGAETMRGRATLPAGIYTATTDPFTESRGGVYSGKMNITARSGGRSSSGRSTCRFFVQDR